MLGNARWPAIWTGRIVTINVAAHMSNRDALDSNSGEQDKSGSQYEKGQMPREYGHDKKKEAKTTDMQYGD